MLPHEYILEDLLKVPGSLPAGKDQIRMHCPICNHPKPKLYVGINKSLLPKMILGYDCKHCSFQGTVGQKFLQMFDITGNEDYVKDIKQRKSIVKTVNPITKMEKLDLKIPDKILPEDEFKMDYLSKRFGRKVTIKDLKTYKIVLNFKQFFEFNNFDYLQFEDNKERRKNIEFLADEYSKHFVGMLSVDNNKINFRNLNSEVFKNKRYMVYVINKNIGNPYMYLPDIPIDLMAAQPTIHMAEGNYDIIGVKEYFMFDEDYSNIFVAIGTKKAYSRVLKQVLKMTGFLNAKLNIYADNDMDSDLDTYRSMLKEFRPLFEEISVIYNEAVDEKGKPCKDFGDLSKPIKPVRLVI